MKKLLPLLSVLFLIYWGCEEKEEDTKGSCEDCGLKISSTLPVDNNGIYQLEHDGNQVQTFTTLTGETNCGWSQHLQWDTDYQYKINTDWVSLVNPSSMTDENGIGLVIFGTWEEFIGNTITVYCGYTDDCENHHLDSLKIRINSN